VTPPKVSERPLDHRLGPIDGAAVVISNVIGGGILFTPPLVAAAVPHPWLFLSAWLAGGQLALAGAIAYAKLGVRLDRIIRRLAVTASTGSAFMKSQCRSAKRVRAGCIATDAKVQLQVAVKI
jgi:hypothetical protein